MIVPEDNIEFGDREAIKEFTVPQHDTGIPLRVLFCGDCGVALWKYADAEQFKGTVIVFTGTLDDDGKALGKMPQSEIWTKWRVDWAGKVGGGELMEYEGFP